MKGIRYALLLFPIVFVYSCRDLQDPKVAKQALFRAENLMEQHPDSALQALETILYPEELSKSQQMNYWLLLVQAKDKCDKDITSDTLITQVKDYFVKKKNWEKATLAAFCHGQVLAYKKQYKEATIAYLDAETFANRTNNTVRKGLIQNNLGSLHYRQDDYEKAIQSTKQAYLYFQQTNHYKYSIEALKLLGNSFLMNKQTDSALFYYDQGLTIAIQHKDTTAQSSILLNIGRFYQRMNDTGNAQNYLLKATNLLPANKDRTRLYHAIAEFFYKTNRLDSASYYEHKALQSINKNTDNNTNITVYYLLSQIEKKQKNYEPAFTY